MKHFRILQQPSFYTGVSDLNINNPKSRGFALKICLFATGCAGIVAEYVLSTLATYLIGNAIFQWTIVMSLMLFSMGVGSRISRYFKQNLLDTFIFIEFSLSVFCAVCAIFAYGIASYTSHTSLFIYAQACIIGALIGLEIPMVTRLNQEYEELRINISNVMEKDYYGALLGGLLFAFIALPYLGLTYTPIVLGAINFTVASFLLWRFFALLKSKMLIVSSFIFVLIFLILLGILAKPIILHGEQRKYKDKVIFSHQTPFQKIVMTCWKDFYWLYINGQEQFSTFDEEKYHEPLVHPAMKLSHNAAEVLILGGGDGLAVREILKHPHLSSLTLVDIDPAMTNLSKSHSVLLDINKGSLNDPRVNVINQDASVFISGDKHLYGVIILDLPDPDSVDLMHLYSESFYRTLKKHLIKGGVLVTQATSPYFSKKAFLCINKTVRDAGFSVLPYHNQIPTMGEWGWVLGMKAEDIDEESIKKLALSKDFSDIPTRFLNNDAMVSMVNFGKGILENSEFEKVEINTELNPVLYRYYLSGSWGMY